MVNVMLNEMGYKDTKKYADQFGLWQEQRDDKEIQTFIYININRIIWLVYFCSKIFWNYKQGFEHIIPDLEELKSLTRKLSK